MKTQYTDALRQVVDAALAGAPERPTARTREWFRVRAAAPMPEEEPADPEKVKPAQPDGTVVDIDIYAEIGSWFDGLTARDFSAALDHLPPEVNTIRVHVNSVGGEVFEALAIANALQRHPAQVEMYIEGIAASAATIITQGGGDVVKIARNALVMIHDPFALAQGTADDFRGAADMLDRVKAAIIATYQRGSNLSAEQLSEMMAASTYMTAEEAVQNGFAADILDATETPVAATVSPLVLASLTVPERHREAVAAMLKARPDAAAKAPAPAPTPDPVPVPAAALVPVPAPPVTPIADAGDVLRLCADAKLDLPFAQALVTAKLSPAQVADRIAQAASVKALCAKAGLPELAEGYILGGMPVERVKAHLVTLTAKLDQVSIDANLGPEDGHPRRQPVIDVRAVYAERNKPRA